MNIKKNLMLGLSLALLVTMAGCTETKTDDKAKTEVKTELDLNAMKLDDIIAKAKEEGRVDSVGMPDTWANWGDTWKQLNEKYGLAHSDVDMSSAEELALFEAEKDAPTKDIGDVGQSFGPVAVTKNLTIPYKTSYWNEIPDWAKDKDGNWIIAYYGTMSFITNNNTVKQAPTSFADLLKGDYKVSLGDVNAGTQSQIAVLSASIANGGSEENLQPGIDLFKELAKQGRIDLGANSLARLEKGEIDVAVMWDFNALNYKNKIEASNPNLTFTVTIPLDGSIQSGYTTVINKYAPHPHAAALAREYILSDEGQINLARGYAKPIRNVNLPEDVKKIMIPDEQYVKARPIQNFEAWAASAKKVGQLWQEQVLVEIKQ